MTRFPKAGSTCADEKKERKCQFFSKRTPKDQFISLTDLVAFGTYMQKGVGLFTLHAVLQPFVILAD